MELHDFLLTMYVCLFDMGFDHFFLLACPLGGLLRNPRCPVTGQTLPLISSGGTSIWMTCLSIGIILSVSKNYELENEIIDQNNPLEILKETI